jgi:hypothetical protein
MQTSTPKSLSWPQVLAGLQACAGESVFIRDGRETQPASAVRTRPAAKGTELCFFPGKTAVSRLDLIRTLETFSKAGGRKFMGASARASIGDAFLLVEGVADEEIDGVPHAVIKTRRPVLGFNQSQQTSSRTTLRSKRIKNS